MSDPYYQEEERQRHIRNIYIDLLKYNGEVCEYESYLEDYIISIAAKRDYPMHKGQYYIVCPSREVK